MKAKYILMLLVAGAALSFTSCKKEDPRIIEEREHLLTRTDIGFYKSKVATLMFDQSKHQLYFNTAANNVFRFSTDNGASYAEITFNGKLPEEGQSIRGDIKVVGMKGIDNMSNVNFTVLKKSGRNCWLWNDANHLGVVIYYF